MIDCPWPRVGQSVLMTGKEEQFLYLVMMEVNRARKKFPKPDGLFRALTEETGELAKAFADEPGLAVMQEAVQVAATAMRIALEGDPTLDFEREENELSPYPFDIQSHLDEAKKVSG